MSKGSRSRRRKERERRLTGGIQVADRPSASDLSSESADSPKAASDGVAKPAAEASHEDAFFAQGEENGSFPPSSVDAPEAEVDETVQRRRRPEVIERRARLRRVVTWIVGAAAVLTALVTVKALVTRSRPPVADTALSVPHQVVASIAMTGTDESAPSPAASEVTNEAARSKPDEAPPAAAETAPAEKAPIETAPAAPTEPAPTVETQQPAEAPAALAPSQANTPSKADIRHLIERGRMKDGIAAARATLDADPSDAETYLLLGAALQELGQWKESMAVFGQCIEQATRGPKSECRALRGH
jgi:Flp pilus assembly protein TadD